MINLKDLWIGDGMKIISTGIVGKFEGVHKNGQAIIRKEGKTFLADSHDLETYEEIEDKKEIVFETAPVSKKQVVADSIDLHIEVLNPDMQGARPERIFDYQVNAFQTYLDAAKKSYKVQCVVIHGKGTLLLRNYVMSIIKADKEIRHYSSVHDGGAVEILF